MALRIAIAQLNYTLCDFAGNLARIRKAIADAGPVDLLVFSELCLSGYYPLDLVEEPDFLPRQQVALDALLNVSRETETALVIGAVTRNPGIGKPLHNSLLLLHRGEIQLCYHKQLLPTYNIFDERRHFEPGPDVAACYALKGHKLGFMICEDGWNSDGLDYAANPWQTLQQAGAELVISINASPSNVGKMTQRQQLFSDAAQRWQMAMLYVNQVGGHD